jgi:SP family sugar:H+ symporter-like MFS transporter
MQDFKLRFAACSDPTDASTCQFTRVRSGTIVSLFSIGTMIGALCGGTYVMPSMCFRRPV